MNQDPFVVIAVFRARPGREQALAAALQQMCVPSRDEPGCINYDLHASAVDAGEYFFHETWASADHHRVHLDSPHVRHLLAITPDMLSEPIAEFKGTRVAA
jgi:quinol monooxygenase YgiN